MRQQTEVLEDHRHLMTAHLEQLVVVGLGHVDTTDQHGAGRRLDQSREAPDEGGLAATRQAHHDEALPRGDIEFDVTHGNDATGRRLELASRQVGLG